MFKKLLIPSAALLLSSSLTSGAYAADLGGDCCADLEERVAVLEATTARKGNRKVSLTISGLVYHQIMVWDDGVDSDAYLGTNVPDAGTHFQFDGKAKINSDWSAGYKIRINVDAGNSYQQSQADDDTNLGLVVSESFMWIKSENLGKISWGQGHPAGDNVSIVDTSGIGSIYSANLVIFDGASFRLRNKAGQAFVGTGTWGNISQCNHNGPGIHNDCDGTPKNVLRYDSPTIGGFMLSASWGEDDLYDVALRYAGTLGDFKVVAGVGYSVIDDDPVGPVRETKYTQFGLSVMHLPTGLFAYGTYGHEEAKLDAARSNNMSLADTDAIYLKAGIRQKWNSLGASVLYGEYGSSDDGFDAGVDTFGAGVIVAGSEFKQYGVGFVQEIDAASLSLFAKWKRYEGEVNTTMGSTIEFEEFDVFGFGGILLF